MERCNAQTLKKERCKRAAKDGTHFCGQHTPSTVVATTEPWVTLKLPTPHKDIRKSVLAKLRTKLRQAPEKRSGGVGHIYVYHLKGEHKAGLMYWKVGMTERAVDVRMAEWERTHKNNHVLLAKSYRVERAHKWVERVVHLYLDYCRVYRYALEKSDTFYTVWAATGASCGPVEENEPEDLVAVHKQVEWFHSDTLDELDAIIRSVIRVL